MNTSRKLLLLAPLLVGDVLAAIHFAGKEDDNIAENASMLPLCVLGMIFGTLCIRFADIIGLMEGPMGHSAWATPIPSPVVAGFGWVMVSLPLAAWLFLG